MAETTEQELDPQEAEKLEQIERDGAALDALIEDLSSSSRRTRQFAARVLALLARREPKILDAHVAELIDALYRPEAQTRWEVLDALAELVPDHAKEIGAAFEGAETALFDELSATLRLSAFHLLCAWGATERGRSKKVWPIIDEAIQCYHGDLEYRDMLGYLHEFAQGKIAGDVAEVLPVVFSSMPKTARVATLRHARARSTTCLPSASSSRLPRSARVSPRRTMISTTRRSRRARAAAYPLE